MRPYRQQFSLQKFIKRAAFITLVLAIIEMLVIFFLMSSKKANSNHSAVEITKNGSDKLTEAPIAKEADNLIPEEIDKVDTSAIIKGKTFNIDSVQIKSVPNNSDLTITSDTIVVDSLPKPDTLKKNIKSLSKASMLKIWRRLTVEKRLHNNKLNCVQIQKTNSSNVQNAFQVAKFLRTKGYTISGRTIVQGDINGIKFIASEACTLIIIGKL